MHNKKSSLLILIVVTFLLLVVSNRLIAADEKIIKVGAAVCVSGFLAREGQLVKQGYDFWSNYVNEHGGIKVGNVSYKVKMIYYDDQSDPITGNKLVEKLITEDKADIIFGSYGSGIVIATSSISEKYKKLMIAPMATAPKIYARGFKYIFNPTMIDPYFGRNYGAFLISLEPKPKTMGILVVNDLYPLTVAEEVKKYVEASGVQIIGEETFSKGTKDLTPSFLRIKPKKPDIMFLSCYFQDSMLALQQMRELNMVPKIIFLSPGPTLPEVYEILGKDSDGITGGELYNPYVQTKDPIFGSNKEFLRLWKEKYTVNPHFNNTFAVLTGEVYQRAVERAGSIETEKVREALLKTNEEFFTGKVSFMENGTPNWNPPYPVMMWKDGKVEYLTPKSGATAKPIYPRGPWTKK